MADSERSHPLADAFVWQSIVLAGHSMVADRSGALYWPAHDALVVADLHLEKASSYALRGTLLPPYDTRETLGRLAEAIDRYEPAMVIALGDSLHDPDAAGRLGMQEQARLAQLLGKHRWIWITGNHDGAVAGALGGEVRDDITLSGVVLRHTPSAFEQASEIAGHLHPAARIALGGRVLRRPCFVTNGRQLVLPAFGTFTGGLNVLDAAFAPLRDAGGLAVWMLGAEGLYPVATDLLQGD